MLTTNAQQKKRLATTNPADVPLELLPIVEVTDEQIAEAKTLAGKRARSSHGYDGRESFGDIRYSDAHLVGIVREIALAELNRTTIDDRCHARGDQGYDLRLGSHLIDIKTMTRALNSPDLLMPPSRIGIEDPNE